MRIAVTLALASSLLAGCASRGFQQSQNTADSMQAAVTSANGFATARQGAFDAMNLLTAEPLEGLPAKFEAFSKAVDGVTSAEGEFRSSIAGMKSAAASRFQAWEAEDATYANPGIQARSQQRRSEAQGVVNKAGSDADAMLEQAAGFVSYLGDLRKLLSNDLTPAGIKGSADLIQNARSSNNRMHQMAQPTLNSLKAAAESLSTR
jgi:hypothetical protein